ncbi:glycerophosphodiester phosphodiesterase family protein [Reichenbachiella sp. MALMAid0571]|uniref:glycerophosphodiester phosphodiesterase family protein n=1 Tax=Reichenbachiella sp. MALMAid0571 TaxID=3143939 RepID=UPI0032DE3622
MFLLSIAAFSQEKPITVRSMLLAPTNDVVLVAAHRGVQSSFPENSIAGIQRALDIGADIVEIDVRVTKDEIAVLMHDDDIDRTTNGSGSLNKFTFAELQSFRLVDTLVHAQEFKIPTLEDVLKLETGDAFFYLDLKNSLKELDVILEKVMEMKASDRVIFYVKDYGSVRKIRKLMPDAFIMKKVYHTPEFKNDLKKFTPNVIHLGDNQEEREVVYISELKPYNKVLNVNSIKKTDPLARQSMDVYSELVQKKVNVILTDYPEILLKYLRSIEKHK